jgi:trimethylamine--corrinoid protein Co-methyltransferase
MDFPVTDYEGDISSYKALEQFFLNINKHISAYCTSVESLQEYFEIGQVLLGDQPLKDSKIMSVAVATLSPLAVTDINCRLMLEAVKYNFPIVPTTCPMAGTTSPYTLIGTFIQGMAEVVGLCAIVQAVNPGNPYLMAFGPSVSSLIDGHDMYYTMDKPIWKLAAAEITACYGIPFLVECGGNTPANFDMQSGAESMMQMLSAVGSKSSILAGVGSCYNANGLSAENIVIGMSLKHAADFMIRGMRLDQLDESMESMERQKDAGYFLMDDLTMDNMRSDEFFSDKTMNMAGEFKAAPSMLERAQKMIAKVKNAYESPVPEQVQERIKAYFAENIYPRFS